MASIEQVILDELDKELQRFVDRVFQLSQENLVEDGHVDTATLLKTANINRGVLSAEIIYPAEYAEWVEFGRLPGSMPPVEPLIKWVRRKLNVQDYNQAQRIAWAIAKSIESRGIKPSFYLRRAINQAIDEFNLREE